MNHAWKIAALSLAISSLVGCGILNGDGQTSSGDSLCTDEPQELRQARAQAFSETLALKLRIGRCNECHDGSGKGPYEFAASDSMQAFSSARKLSDLDKPDNSRLVAKVRSMHNCGDSSTCAALADNFVSAITQWKVKESSLPSYSCNGPRKVIEVVTDAQVVRSEDLDDKFKPFRWDLSKIHPALSGVWFEVRMKRLTAPQNGNLGAYVIARPLLATPKTRFRVSRMGIQQNGAINFQATNFVGTSFVVEGAPFEPDAVAWNFPSVSPYTQMMAWTTSGGDKIAFKFYLEETTEVPSEPPPIVACKALDKFRAPAPSMKTIMTSKCVTCHNGDDYVAFGKFPMTGADSDLCLVTLTKVNLNDPLSSRLFYMTEGGKAVGHGEDAIEFTLAEKNAIVDWIIAEAQ